MSSILFVGGGSVGHIAPAVAVWRTLKELSPQSKIHFVCARRKGDEEFLKGEQLAYTAIDAPKLSLFFLWKFGKSVWQAANIFRTHKPDLVFSKGGFVSVPVCLAAAWNGVPVVLHESDSVSGRANTFIGWFAAHICLGFPSAAKGKKMLVTGNPVRREISGGSKEKGKSLTGFAGDRPVLLVMGGSQGAQAINEAVTDVLPTLTQTFDVVHLTGEGKGASRNEPHYWSRPFVQEELPDVYALADVAVSRAGAGSIAELAANNIPTILVPLRGVGHDHQQRNADVLGKGNVCIVLQQECLRAELPKTLAALVADNTRMHSMADKFGEFAHPDAARRIAKVILDCIAKPGGQS
jgi:UDP-N-acetylglucosamine--N-acetylmuramyl-(pentapeptide) pyrophosphoryl-undecaprenol N-acetylglucosamine transferase